MGTFFGVLGSVKVCVFVLAFSSQWLRCWWVRIGECECECVCVLISVVTCFCVAGSVRVCVFVDASPSPPAANWWLSYWSDSLAEPVHHSSKWYLTIYGLITVGSLVVSLVLKIYFVTAGLRAARSMHEVCVCLSCAGVYMCVLQRCLNPPMWIDIPSALCVCLCVCRTCCQR